MPSGVSLDNSMFFNSAMGDREKIMEAGCNGYLSKPINVDEFMKEVAKHL